MMVCSTILNVMIGGGIGFAAAMLKNEYLTLGGQIASQITSLCVNTYFQIGMIALSLKVVRGEPAEISDLFSQTHKLVPAIVASILTGIGVVMGMFALCIGGLFVWALLSFTMYFIVDRDLDAIPALQASVEVAKGNLGGIFGFWLAAMALGFLGLIPCGLGLLVVMPMINLAMAHIYLAVSDTVPMDDF